LADFERLTTTKLLVRRLPEAIYVCVQGLTDLFYVALNFFEKKNQKMESLILGLSKGGTFFPADLHFQKRICFQ
jgi:hypothetical protein